MSTLGFFGGTTPTVPLGSGSPAIDSAGSSHPGNSDQRGLARIGAPDIGATEFQPMQATLALAPGFDPLTNPRVDMTLDPAPGLSYFIEASDSLSDFTPIRGSAFSSEQNPPTVELRPTRDFARITRAPAHLLGLTAHWDFEGDFLNTEVALGGTEGETLDAIAQDGASLDLNGILGQAASFDGTDDYLDVTGEIFEDNEDASDDSYTISAWFQLDAASAPSGSTRHQVYETTPNFAVSLGLRESGNDTNRTNIQFFIDIVAPDPNLSLDVELPDNEVAGQWIHAVQTFDSTTGILTAFINGIQVGILNPGDTSQLDGFHIGSRRDPSGRFFPGLIDEVAVWNRPLSPSEIAVLYNGGAPLPIFP